VSADGDAGADGDQAASDLAAAGTHRSDGPGCGRAAGVGLNLVDGILAIGAGVMVVFVHDLKFWLWIPYWLDEGVGSGLGAGAAFAGPPARRDHATGLDPAAAAGP